MAYRLQYSDYSTTAEGPPDPERWEGPPGPPGPVGPQGAQGPAGNVIISDTPPTSPGIGTLWLNTVDLQTYIWYPDPTSAQFIPIINQPLGIQQSAADSRYLQLTGGTLSGPLSLPGQISVPVGGSIQAAINALPATGGTVTLAANTTYIVTSMIWINTPNVRLTAPNWNTIVQRAPSYTNGTLISSTTAATGFVIENFTIDGNSAAVNTSTMELAVAGGHSLVRNMQIINSTATGHMSLAGNNSRATGNTISGTGNDLGIETGYGIWAVNHQTVMIDHNTVSGTGIDGIGFDGNGSQCIGNRVFGCHCWQGGPGGQIASYVTGNTTGGVIANNTIGPGGPKANGIEAVMSGMTIVGNVMDGIAGYGILVTAPGQTIVGNVVRNCAQANMDGIEVLSNVTDLVIAGNRIADERATPIMRTGIWVSPGCNRYTIVGNTISGYTMSIGIVDQGSGPNKTIARNVGVDDVMPHVVATSPLAMPINPVIYFTGSPTITSMDISTETVRSVTLIPQGAMSFVAGSGIANSFTATAGVPIMAAFDGANWHFK